MENYELTYEQYHAAENARVAAENGVDVTKIDRYYPVSTRCRHSYWCAEIDNACRAGLVIPTNVIDSMSEESTEVQTLRYFRGIYEQCKPVGYLPVSVRTAPHMTTPVLKTRVSY